MASSTLNLSLLYQSAPFIWGSTQNALLMSFIAQGAPYVVSNQQSGAQYVMDVLGRLSQINFTNGTTITYNYDAMGNRTSVVTSCGPSGC